MRLIKSQKIGFLQRTYGHGKTFYYVASPIVFFDLNNNQILMENQQWNKVASALGAEALDHGLPKTCGEFLLAGHAYPYDSEKEVLYPSVTIAGKSKQLKVSGNRNWKFSILRGTCPTEPEVIDKPISLDWSTAYGGQDYKFNPLGTGHTKKTLPPHVEKEGYGTEYPGKKTPAMSFLPMAMTWPQRSKYEGKYKKDWFDKYFPAFAPSTDLKLFNCAQDDQHIDGFFQGDESYRLTHLHPQSKDFEGTLPNIVVRAFVNYQESFIELPLDLDTVWFMPSVGLGALIFRGQIPVQTTEFLEVSDILLGYENRAEMPKPEAHYKEVFELRTNKETALANVMNEGQLSPTISEQQQGERQQQVQQQRANRVAEIKAYQQKMLKSFAPKVAAAATLPEPELTPADDILEQDVQSGNIDLTPLLNHAEAKTQQAEKDGEARMAELLAKFPQATEQQPQDQQLDACQIEENLTTSYPLGSHEQQAILSQQLTIKPGQGLTISAQDNQRLRDFVTTSIANHTSLSCKNLTGVDLSLLTFADIDFSEAILSHANLQNCIFENCNFSAAALVNANLTSCVFINCNMTAAQLSGATGRKVCFQTCTLENLLWRYTKLTESKFENCSWASSTLLHSDFTRSRFINCVFTQSTITQCRLTDSDLIDCQLSQAICSETNMQMTRWQGCVLKRVALQLCPIQLATFSELTSHKLVLSTDVDIRCSSWFNCQLELTSFRTAKALKIRVVDSEFIQCDFSLAKLDFSQFKLTKLLGCVASQALWRASFLYDCNLYQSRFRAAQFTATNFIKCNFLDTDFMWVKLHRNQLKKCQNFSKVMVRDLARQPHQEEVSDDQIRTIGTA